MKEKDFTITICIVNYNSSEFILNTLYCLKNITKNGYKIIIRDNNSKEKDFLNLKKKIKDYENTELYRVENFNYTGSLAHGIAINDLIDRIDTKYGVILDADCTFLYKNWDEILINEINGEYPIIGTQAAQDYGSEKIGDFPLMYAIFFYTDILKKINVDFKPKKAEVFIDTGYQLRDRYLAHNYKGKLLIGKNSRGFRKGPFHELICTEYYKIGIKEIFACHFGRGSTLGIAKYKREKKKDGTKGPVKIPYIIPFFGRFLLKLKGKREKRKWIKICKNLVKNQYK